MSEGIVLRSRRPDHEFEIEPSTTSDAAELEPISPELALVDPKLRSEALRKLPVGGGARSKPGSRRDARPGSSGASALPAPAAPVGITATRAPQPPVAVDGDTRVQQHEAHRRHRWRKRTAIVAFAIVLGAVGVALASRFPPRQVDRGTSQRQALAGKDVTQRPATRIRTARKAQTSVPPPKASAKPPPKHSAKLPPKASAKPRPKHSAKLPPKHSAKTRAPRRSSPVSSGARANKPKPTLPSTRESRSRRPPATPLTRLFVWPAAKHAAYYKVEFFRRGRLVFEAWPAQPRLQLPLRWEYKGRSMRVVSGVYSWRVSPAFGTRSHARYGDPIVRSTWVART
jgi:hypothetical protein